jgi:IMP cyclohydrolase
MTTLEEAAGACEYPGRGLAIGRDSDGVPFIAYWLTGRSPASQLRDVVVRDREIIVQDVSGSATDDLRHYTAATRGDNWVIVGNGTQVSEVTAGRSEEPDLQRALRALTYEPDPPIRTPRILGGGVITGTEMTEVVVGSARAYEGAEEKTQHPSLYTARLEVGTAIMMTTYAGTADQVVTDGQPRAVGAPSSWKSLTEALWNLLVPSLRVAVVAVPLDKDSFVHGTVLSKRS